ncbi:MAG: redoxin family protein [Alteromonadales bacterium]|nr:redoxin family protein [Alteromonadales bacterium]
MIKVIMVSIVLVIVFLFSRGEKMPMGTLSVHNENALVESSDFVGGSCFSEKCLIVYVAPWCPTCNQITPTIISLVDEIEKEGISVKVIVGKDNPKRVDAYAKKFPFPVLTDANGSYFKEAKLVGVPYFAVTNSNGEVLNDYFGGYTSVKAFRKKLEI